MNDCTLCLKRAGIEVGTKSTEAPMLILGIQQLAFFGGSPRKLQEEHQEEVGP